MKNKRKRHFAILAGLLFVIAYSAPGWGQMVVYPAGGQTPDQQNRDRYECHSWAVQQSRYDPTTAQAYAAPPSAPQEAPQGGAFRGAARGAAIGAVGGAIGGDAGRGAAIGAATGALFGAFRRRDQQRRQQSQQQQYQQQQAQAQSNARNTYNRALATCLQGRGYSVSY